MTRTRVQFAQFTAEEAAAVATIIDRYEALCAAAGWPFDRQTAEMDLSACHATCPLDLVRLSTATDADIVHDVSGISAHLNRRTGQLADHFLPRFARPEVRRG